tara:strand:+ start:826 stop:1158 length:333 start_codon:yes stop_codon:yes gene_type:complete
MNLKTLPLWMLAASAALAPLPAAADAIDGHWCSQSRPLSLTIEGPTIVTPGGIRMQGNYDRHYFSYTAPVGDAEAGRDIFMTLVDDETMHLVQGSERARFEIWKRCGPSA